MTVSLCLTYISYVLVLFNDATALTTREIRHSFMGGIANTLTVKAWLLLLTTSSCMKNKWREMLYLKAEPKGVSKEGAAHEQMAEVGGWHSVMGLLLWLLVHLVC